MTKSKPATPKLSDSFRKPKAFGGYAGARDESGLTPNQRLLVAKAEAQEFENQREREKWRTKEDAEARDQDTRELIQADLYSTVPLSLAGKLSGKIFTPAEVRLIVRNEIDIIIRQWRKGERIPEGCTPE